ncbi:MAG: cellulase family glycosylhydrolase [Lachnospiraceae bacterium]|nr:cellulase family glycosylhydrolase [Lachnospiraceae bacterium]
MRKRKFLAIAICIGLLSGILTGCGKGSVDSTETTPPESVEESTETTIEREDPKETPEASSEPEETEPEDFDPTQAAPSLCGALHVDGTQLVDEQGRPVQLRGISTHGLQWFPEYVNEDCFRELHEDWKANVIRLAMYTAEGGYCEGDKESFKELIANGVEYATNQDMYVIIDWHILSDNNPNNHKEEAKAFFEEMAENYADYNNVLYEICNEPNGGTGWKDIKSYAEEIIPIIRSYDEDAIILVGTPTWSQNVDQAAADPITGYDNIMYTLHFYAATHKESLQNTMTAAIDAGLPVFVSEYGICDASGNGGIDEASSAKWISTMNAYGVSYVVWNLSNKNETSAILKSSCNKTSGFTAEDLSTCGKWVYKMLTGETEFEALERNSSAQGGNGNQSGGSGNHSQNGGDALESGMKFSRTDGDFGITVEFMGSWETGDGYCYQYTVEIQNNSDSTYTDWGIKIPFTSNISLDNGWCANFTVNGSVLEVTAEDWNGYIEPGGTVSGIGIQIVGPKDLRIAE